MNVKPLAVAALLAMTTSVWAAPAVQSVDRVLAVVDKQVITLGEFQDALQRNRAALPKGSSITDQQLQSKTLSNLVDRSLMVQMAGRTGIQVSDTEIKQNMGLVNRGAEMSERQWQAAVRDELLVEKLKQRDLYSKVRVSDAEITQAIDSLPEKDKKQSSGHTVTAYLPQHILITVDSKTKDAEALAKIRELRSRISNGENFETVARSQSQDPGSAKNGGVLGWAVDGMMVPEFENAMKSLPKGALSEPVRSSYGYHIIRVLDTRQQDAGDAELRAKVRKQLVESKSEQLYENWINQLRQSAFVSVRQ
ncbi:peptidylprolyl isomerase [Vitreoscilla massiliensis]|uniref:Peptidylprolyl isomerase n=1 Tax=Vitreoscilla massiliensis TaxID=1689272 RepID=A0ABY4E6X7_9NEIS|nr:peptidylprolyl isomerase [Vitreoscilla massiliensis]UOO91214.1 peptidylprolyl isomerase [Vitreoscilla massiliensis]